MRWLAALRQLVFKVILFLVVTLVPLTAFLGWATLHGYPPRIAAEGLLTWIGVLSAIEPEMVTVPADYFQMRPLENEAGRFANEGSAYTVTSRRPFSIGKYEVTFAEYDRFAAATGQRLPNDEGWGRGSRPVINVSWQEVQAYIEWLNKKVARDKTFRLPTEAEWEYACRANTQTIYHSGNTKEDLKRVAWYEENSDDQTHPVGDKKPNTFGLYDMLGNVWEWCEDLYYGDYYEISPNENPQRPQKAFGRVLRGCGWVDSAQACRAEVRGKFGSGRRSNYIGFRLLAE